VLEETMA